MLLQQLINGIALGSTYALIALGYTMVYGIIASSTSPMEKYSWRAHSWVCSWSPCSR